MNIKQILWILLMFCAGKLSAQAYRIGDLYTAPDGSQGIVFYLHPDGSGGWVVALNDASTSCMWGHAGTNLPNVVDQDPIYPQVLMNDTGGYSNTQTIRNVQANNTEYAAWIVDFEHGWYLPAPGQMRVLYAQMPFITTALLNANGSPLANATYWVSAEVDDLWAWALVYADNTGGYFYKVIKDNIAWNCRVREVRSFSYPEYRWNTGASSASIQVSPAQSTDYSVVVTTSTGESEETTFHLDVLPLSHTDLPVNACDSFEWNGSTYTRDSIFTVHLSAANGCDSAVTLQLTINHPTQSDTIAVACDSFTWHGVTYTETPETPPTYTIEGGNATGCDSVVTLHLTINHPTQGDTIAVACDSFTWHGVTYSETPETAPTYTIEGGNSSGCDSVVTLHLTIRHGTSFTLDTAVVQNALPFVWDSVEYNVSDTYTLPTMTNVAGCDSMVTIHLTVYDNVLIDLDSTVCADKLPIIWNDSIFTSEGTKTILTTTSKGADSVVVMTLTVTDNPFLSDTLILNQELLPYYYAPADTVIPSGSSDTVQFTYSVTDESGCDTIVAVTLFFLEFQPLSLSMTSQVNTQCDGNGCQYDGPTILINEVMLRPTVGDGSIVGDVLSTPSEGEWIELYNPHKCESVDISGYFLGNNASDLTINQGFFVQGDWGGGFALPPGTVVPAQGFCVVRGPSAPAVPANLLVENGGNTVEVIVNSRYCIDSGGRRLWFPNLGGWFAFYDAEGVPQDAIYWGDISNFCHSCPPCTPTASDIAFAGTLASFNGIPNSKKTYIANVIATGMSLRRVPDGGAWSPSFVSETYGTCNTTCVDPPVITCNGYAVAQVTGGVPPFTYLWDDPQAQTTDTAFQLCAGTYTVTVTDALGETLTAQATVTDFVPVVSHPNAQFCFSEASGVLQGIPEGGTYEGAPMTGNTLIFQENVTEYQMTYTYTDENGCYASAPFQVAVIPNTREMDTTVCGSDLPYLWYNQSITTAGTYQKTVQMDGSCDSLLTLHLTVIQQPQLVVDDDVMIEPGETVTLHASGAATYHWTPAASLSSPNSATPQASPSQSTMYYVTGYATESCSAMDSVAVLVYQHHDTTVCENELPLTLHGLLFEDTVTQYLTIPHAQALAEVWQLHLHVLPVTYSSYSFNITENELPFVFNGLSFSDDVDTTFVVPNSYGCDSVISFTLVVCWNVELEVDSVVCESDLPFFWNDILVTEANDYQAVLNTSCGADSTVLMHFSVIDTALHIVPLTNDFCEDQMMELMVETPMPDYIWSTGETAPNITVTQPGIYSITASQGDCRSVAFYQVHSCHSELYLPNAITPSRGDGLNDYFSIPETNLGDMAIFEISIYNRWGELVFHSADKNFKWNGEYKGVIQHQTTYNYIIKYTDSVGRPHRLTGSITVL